MNFTDGLRLVRRVREALLYEGPRPDVHRAELHRLRTRWPVLYNAVMATLTDAERRHLEDGGRT